MFSLFVLAAVASCYAGTTLNPPTTATALSENTSPAEGTESTAGPNEPECCPCYQPLELGTTPVTKDEVLSVLARIKKFSSTIQGEFAKLNNHTSAITAEGFKNQVDQLIRDLKELHGNAGTELSFAWYTTVLQLMMFGAEEEGECHTALERLIKMEKDARAAAGGKRQMSPEEGAFGQEVVKDAKVVIGCIVNRYQEFIDLVSSASVSINNSSCDENGHSFKVEAHMGSLYIGYEYLYRQVRIFTDVMEFLMNVEKKPENIQGKRQLHQLLEQAQLIKREMANMKALQKFRYEA